MPEGARHDEDPPDFRDLLDCDPKPYPCPVGIDPTSAEAVDLAGRRTAVSLQMFSCQTCSCCGRVTPFHDDPYFPDDAADIVFSQKHLKLKYHDAWRCSCDACARGAFYAAQRPSIMNQYRRNHMNRNPWEVMGIESQVPNALICDHCYNEYSAANPADASRESIAFCNNYIASLH